MNRLLLVEDCAALSRLLTWELTSLKYDVRPVPTFVETRQRIDRVRFDFALLVCGLPDGYGPDLLEYLQYAQPHVIPILMSGDPDRCALKCRTHAKSAPLLSKPVSLTQLQSVLGSGRVSAGAGQSQLYRRGV